MLNELSAKTVDGDVKFREDMQMAPGDNFEVIQDELTKEEVDELLKQKQL